MRYYRMGGRATAISAGQSTIGNLWNPSSTVPIWLAELTLDVTSAVALGTPWLQTTDDNGTTPSSTVTADIDSHVDKALAPPSGAVLSLGVYSLQPHALAGAAASTTHSISNIGIIPASIGAGMLYQFDPPMKIKPGRGLAVLNASGEFSICEMSVGWWE